MSWKSIRIKLDHGGMDAMLKSDPVADALENIGEDIAVKAEAIMPTHDGEQLSYDVITNIGRTRAMTWVATNHLLGPAIERKYGPLRKAVRQED